MSITLIIILLVVVALMLFAIEGLLFPGYGIAGITAAACVLVADVLVYTQWGTTAAILSVLVSTAVVIGFFWWFAHSKALDRMALNATIDSTAPTAEQRSVTVGDEGVALTRLALIGRAEINGKIVEVKSESGFLDEGTPVVVSAIDEAAIMVKQNIIKA